MSRMVLILDSQIIWRSIMLINCSHEKSLTSVSGQNVCAINCAGMHIENSLKKTSIAGMGIFQNKRLLILQLLTLPANR